MNNWVRGDCQRAFFFKVQQSLLLWGVLHPKGECDYSMFCNFMTQHSLLRLSKYVFKMHSLLLPQYVLYSCPYEIECALTQFDSWLIVQWSFLSPRGCLNKMVSNLRTRYFAFGKRSFIPCCSVLYTAFLVQWKKPYTFLWNIGLFSKIHSCCGCCLAEV